MKLQKLTIHNIASIEDAVIDFDAKPLSTSEVFLITGKTGAGKSTILDSICLALFANTPRLVNTKMQGESQDGESDIKITDPRQLMRKNTSDAFAKLTFIGSNGVHYEAMWSVKRARGKVDGNLQGKSWQLTNIDNGSILSKDKEISTEIHNAVGLDFSQFCRTTMLAQGEFTRFLNSEDKDKAEILEKITGVDVYSKIGAKVYAVTKEKERNVADAQLIVENTHTLTENEKSEKENTLTALDQQYTAINVSSDADKKKCDWLNNEAILINRVKDAEDALKIATETSESDEYKEKEILVKEWNSTIDARHWMDEAQNASTILSEQKRELERLESEFSYLLGGYDYAIKEKESIESAIKNINVFLADESEKSSVYENSQTIIEHLSAIDEGRKIIESNNQKIASENSSLNDELQPALKKAEKAEAEARKELSGDESVMAEKEKDLKDLNLPKLRQDRDSDNLLLSNIKIARERLESLSSIKSQRIATENDLSKQKADIEENTKKSVEMEQPIKEAEIVMDVCKKHLESQRDTIDKFAIDLRSKLQKGDVCPICGQKIESDLPQNEALAELAQKAQDAYDEAEKKHRALVDAKRNLDATINSETSVYNRRLDAFNSDTSVATAEQKAKEACKVCNIDDVDDATISKLDSLTSAANGRLIDLDRRLKEGEAKEMEVKKLRKELDDKRSQIDTLVLKTRSAERAVKDCESRIATSQALVKTKTKEIDTSKEKVANLVSVVSWNIDWNVNPKEFADNLKTVAQKYKEMVQQKQKLEGNLQAATTNCASVSTVVNSIWNLMPEWKNINATSVVMVSDLLKKINEVDNNVTSVLTKIKSADGNLSLNNKRLDDFFLKNNSLTSDRLKSLSKYHADAISSIEDMLKKDKECVVEKRTLYDNAVKHHKEHSEDKPEISADETLEVLQERISGYAEILKNIGEKKGAIDNELKEDQRKKIELGNLIKDVEKKRAAHLKWSRLNDLIGDASGSKFRKIAQSYVLANLIHSANSYMKTLTDRYILDVKPGTFVILLKDAYQGYATRAASTISGGEGFLVSLALALALSDIGQKMTVDTLFIDEGFGTLSGEPLQNAINTLRTLHTKGGRHVGIISHVEELQERIPVQIQVIQEGYNSSSHIEIYPM